MARAFYVNEHKVDFNDGPGMILISHLLHTQQHFEITIVPPDGDDSYDDMSNMNIEMFAVEADNTAYDIESNDYKILHPRSVDQGNYRLDLSSCIIDSDKYDRKFTIVIPETLGTDMIVAPDFIKPSFYYFSIKFSDDALGKDKQSSKPIRGYIRIQWDPESWPVDPNDSSGV